MARQPLIAGNWKMNKTLGEALELAGELKARVNNLTQTDVLMCVPFVYVAAVSEAMRGSTLMVGAQDLYFEDSGAFTGQVSGPMLVSAGCEWVIVGHSERRHVFGETIEDTKKKVAAALEADLKPILCVGELLEEREKNLTEKVVKEQLEGAVQNLPEEEFNKLVIAYEPVWAIGTGKTATPHQAQEVHAYIRKLIGGIRGAGTADSTRILYGGSVKPENIKDLMAEADIDGALVGGASLNADSFEKIVRFYE